MSNRFITIIALLILFVIFIYAFSASYISRNMTNMAYVLALGIDVGENAKMKISAQFTKTAVFSSDGGSSSDDDSNIVIVSGEADSLFSGLNLLNSYIGKEINLSHCNAVVFSEEFAKQGISSQIYTLTNNEEIRLTTNILVSTCDAYDYLKNVKPNLEKLTVQYYDTFSINNRFTGFFSNMTIGDFYNDFSPVSAGATAILGGLDATARQKSSENETESKDENNSENIITDPKYLTAGNSSIESKRGSENIGMAVFNGDTLCGKLTALETMCHMLLQDKLDSCIVSIDNPMINSSKVELQTTPSKKPKVSVDVSSDIPTIDISLFIDADILTLNPDIDYSSNEVLDKFSESAEKYFEEQINCYLEKISKEYNTDIQHFFTKALAYFPTISKWEDYNWQDKFKKANFNVSVNVDVISSLLLVKT